VVEQRTVELGPRVNDLRVIDRGLNPQDLVVVAGVLRAIPGQKVDPQVQTANVVASPPGPPGPTAGSLPSAPAGPGGGQAGGARP